MKPVLASVCSINNFFSKDSTERELKFAFHSHLKIFEKPNMSEDAKFVLIENPDARFIADEINGLIYSANGRRFWLLIF